MAHNDSVFAWIYIYIYAKLSTYVVFHLGHDSPGGFEEGCGWKHVGGGWRFRPTSLWNDALISCVEGSHSQWVHRQHWAKSATICGWWWSLELWNPTAKSRVGVGQNPGVFLSCIQFGWVHSATYCSYLFLPSADILTKFARNHKPPEPWTHTDIHRSYLSIYLGLERKVQFCQRLN